MKEEGEAAAPRRWKSGVVAGAVVILLAGLAVGGFAAGRSQRRPPLHQTEAAAELDAQATTSGPRASTSTIAVISTTSMAPPTASSPTQSPSTAPVEPPAANYTFPVSPASSASYGKSHHDYPAADIFAPCGTDAVAPYGGTVQEISLTDTWSSSVNSPESRGGLSYSIVGDDGVRYYGSHLRELDSAVRPGARVTAGQRLGAVGDTGNAAGTGCHLHFGISTPCGPGDVLRRRGEFWPQPYLDAWRRSESVSPTRLTATTSC